MPDLDLTKYYNFQGQRIKVGGFYSDFYAYPFGLPYRSIVYEEGYIPLSFDVIKYIRDHNSENPGELPTTNKEYYIFAKPELVPTIGSDPVMAIIWEAIPNTGRFRTGFKFRLYQSGGSEYGEWNAQAQYTYHYFDDSYIGVDPENVTGEDHWRQEIRFIYMSNIDGYDLPQDTRDRYGVILQHYKGSVEAPGDPYIYDGYTFPAATDFGTPPPDLDPSYPGEHRVFSYGTFFAETLSGRSSVMIGRGIYTAFMAQFEEAPDDSPGNWFDLDDDEAPELPDGDYDPDGYEGKNNTEYGLPTKSVLTSGLFQLFYPSTAELQAFAQYLWSSDYEDSLKRYGMKPMDNIVNFGIIPFDVTEIRGSSTEVELCGVGTGVNLSRANKAYLRFDTSTIFVDSKMLSDSYLDYTQANFKLYIPCIGFVDLRGCDIINNSVGIQYRGDCSPGDLIANVVITKGSDKWYAYSFTGNCMFKLPLTSADYASYYRTQRAGLLSMLGSAGSVVGAALGGAAMGGPIGGVAAGIAAGVQSINSMWDSAEALKSNVPNVQRGGEFSGSLSYLGYPIPYIIYDCPKVYRNGFYPSYSYPTMARMKLSQCSGWTQVARVDLDGISATSTEKEMIRALLKDGVYIKSAT